MPSFYGPDGRWQEIPGLQPGDLDEVDGAKYVMGQMASEAVACAREVFQKELDYTPASVVVLEEIMAKLHSDKPRGWLARLLRTAPSAFNIYQYAVMWGGYLGEVLRLHHDGEWVIEHPDEPGVKGYYMQVCGTIVGPVAQVQLRLGDLPGVSVVTFYEMLTGSKPG